MTVLLAYRSPDHLAVAAVEERLAGWYGVMCDRLAMIQSSIDPDRVQSEVAGALMDCSHLLVFTSEQTRERMCLPQLRSLAEDRGKPYACFIVSGPDDRAQAEGWPILRGLADLKRLVEG